MGMTEVYTDAEIIRTSFPYLIDETDKEEKSEC